MTPSLLAHPEWLLPGMALWLLLGAGLLVAFRRGEGALLRLLGATPGRAARVARDGLLWVAFGAILIAAVGPRYGTRELRVPASGLDAVLLLDLSRSMDAEDTPPSRLVRARAIAEGLLARLGEGDRAALAVFAGQAAVLTPLTPDKNALTEMLPALDTRLMAHTASRGREAIEHVLPTYDGSGLRPRVLIVISDGEVGAIDAELIATVAQKEIRVLAALVGTETGARIPESKRWMLDGDGRPVVTQREVGRLAPLLSATRGRAFLADAWGALDLEAVTAEVRREAIPASDGTIRRRIPVTWVALPAGLALVLLLLESWPGPWRRAAQPAGRAADGAGRVSPAAMRAASLLVASVCVAWPRPALPEDDPRSELERRLVREAGDAGLLVELGLERVRAGDAEEARHAFRAATARARHPGAAALAWFDLGVLALEQGRLEEARDAFFDAATVSGVDAALDRKVKFNLEWTLTALQARDTPPPAPSPSEDPTASREDAEAADEPEPSGEAEAARDPEESSPAEGEAPEDPAEAESGDASGGDPDGAAPAAPPPLGPDEARRWLEQVDDDVRAAIEARLAETRKADRSGPRW